MEITDRQSKKNVFDLVLDAMAFVAGILLLVITLMVTYSVTLRYLGFRPPLWVLQYTEYGLLWITFLGAAWLLRSNGHIKIDTVISALPAKVQSKIEILNSLLGCLVTFIILIFSWLHTVDLFQRGILEVRATNVSKYLIFLIIPFGSLVLLLQFMRDTWQKIQQELGK